MKATFNTKIAKDIKRNGQTVEILKKHENGYMYYIKFPDGRKVWAYGSELIFEY